MTDEQRPDDRPGEDHHPAPHPGAPPTPWWSGQARNVWDTRPDPQPHPTPGPSADHDHDHDHDPAHDPAPDGYDTLFDDSLFDGTRDEPTAHDVWAPTDTLGREPKPSSRVGLLVALAAAIALVAGVAGGAAGFLLAEHDSSSQTVDGASLGATPARHVARPDGSIPGVAAAVLPSVVQIKVVTSQGQATGSGFVVDETGVVVTNNHVVADSQGDVVLSFSDGRKTTAKVVGTSASYDLAVLRIDAKNVPALTLGNSDGVVVGDPVLAIGSPLGLSGTVTSGIVSAKNRPVTAGGDQGGDSAYINAIQTDAAINPGNSGGPLVNLDGEVIGVNSAIATVGSTLGGESGNIGVGFAIPINQVRRTVEQLLGKGQAQFPIIGASLDGAYDGEGARIAADAVKGNPPIVPGGPAEKAGLHPGDVILSLDGTKVEGNAELIVAIRARRPGDAVTLRVRRNGAEHDVRVILGSHEG